MPRLTHVSKHKRTVTLPVSHVHEDLGRFKRIRKDIDELIKDDEKALKQKQKFTEHGEAVLATGQADDLISDTGTRRVWRSRIDDTLSEEELINGRWELVG